MPDWHIECKATKSANLTQSVLKKWYLQVERDCPKEKSWVILNKADGKEVLAIISLTTWQQKYNLTTTVNSLIIPEGSFDASAWIKKVKQCEALLERIQMAPVERSFPIVYLCVEGLDIVVCMQAIDWISIFVGKEENA